MTPFDRGVRAGLAAAARVADAKAAEADECYRHAVGDEARDRCAARSVTATAIGIAIRAFDPATIKETGDGRAKDPANDPE